eukprot:2258520-Pyramimonas_sp.AAC.1
MRGLLRGAPLLWQQSRGDAMTVDSATRVLQVTSRSRPTTGLKRLFSEYPGQSSPEQHLASYADLAGAMASSPIARLAHEKLSSHASEHIEGLVAILRSLLDAT